MSPAALSAAMDEVRRFVVAAEALQTARQAKGRSGDYDNPKEGGALRRASLDLTRSLAVLRRS